jgi:hypothetical protein
VDLAATFRTNPQPLCSYRWTKASIRPYTDCTNHLSIAKKNHQPIESWSQQKTKKNNTVYFCFGSWQPAKSAASEFNKLDSSLCIFSKLFDSLVYELNEVDSDWLESPSACKLMQSIWFEIIICQTVFFTSTLFESFGKTFEHQMEVYYCTIRSIQTLFY